MGKTFLVLTVLLTLAFLIVPIKAETTFFDQDDAFVLGHSTITPTTDGGLIGGGGCLYKWNCTNWSECLLSGKQTRNCTNIGTCSSTYNSPKVEQNCTYTAPKVEEDKKFEKENITEKEEEKTVEIPKDGSAEENQIEKPNYPFVAITLVTILVLGWIYYLWKKK